MFNQDERKIECAFGNREICVLQGKKAEIVLILCISDVGICGIYLSLALGTAKFKKLDWLFFFFFKGAEGQKSFLCIHCCTNISLLQKNPCIFYKTRSLYSNFSSHFWDSPKKQTKVPTLSTISNIFWNHYIYIMLSLRPRPCSRTSQWGHW